jgi:hypothetical protein
MAHKEENGVETMAKANIKFDKRKSENLKFSGKGKFYYAENFEGPAFNSLIIFKILIFSWSKQIP